ECVAGFVCQNKVCVRGGSPDCPGVDLQRDLANCGACAHACPTPLNAQALCSAGSCGRGPCALGTFDFDGPATFGCEATCTGKTCKDGRGNTVVVTAPPLPETGAVFQALASGSSYGGRVQTNACHTHI